MLPLFHLVGISYLVHCMLSVLFKIDRLVSLKTQSPDVFVKSTSERGDSNLGLGVVSLRDQLLKPHSTIYRNVD